MGKQERKSRLILQVEEQYGRPIEELLRERHRALGNYVKVAEEIGVKPSTVYYWFRTLGIPLSQYVVPDAEQVPA